MLLWLANGCGGSTTSDEANLSREENSSQEENSTMGEEDNVSEQNITAKYSPVEEKFKVITVKMVNSEDLE